MRSYIVLLQGAATILVIFVLHTIIAYNAPYPLREIHTIYLSLLWMIIRNQKTKALWLALVFGYLTEVFSAEVFGVHMATLMASVIVISWTYEKLFTNHAWYIITIVGVYAFLVHRLLYIVISSGTHAFKNLGFYATGNVLAGILVEVAVNTAALIILYAVSKVWNKRSNPRYI